MQSHAAVIRQTPKTVRFWKTAQIKKVTDRHKKKSVLGRSKIFTDTNHAPPSTDLTPTHFLFAGMWTCMPIKDTHTHISSHYIPASMCSADTPIILCHTLWKSTNIQIYTRSEIYGAASLCHLVVVSGQVLCVCALTVWLCLNSLCHNHN